MSLVTDNKKCECTCCVHVTRVWVCEEGQEVISAASHALGCLGTQLLDAHG